MLNFIYAAILSLAVGGLGGGYIGYTMGSSHSSAKVEKANRELLAEKDAKIAAIEDAQRKQALQYEKELATRTAREKRGDELLKEYKNANSDLNGKLVAARKAIQNGAGKSPSVAQLLATPFPDEFRRSVRDAADKAAAPNN